MTVRTSTNTVIALTSMLVIVFSTTLWSARAFGPALGSPNAQIQALRPEWLDGSGKDLRIKLVGTVLSQDGTAANGCKLTVRLRTHADEVELPSVIEGNRYEVWVPVGNVGLGLWLHVSATSADGRQIARAMIPEYELRQAAINGLTLRMKKPERFVKVTVVENGRSVPGASVTAEFVGERITGKTNDAGVATFPVMNSDKLSQLTAWTNDFKIGGYSFNRDPPRNPMGCTFTIDLDKCRPQTIRIINDEDKSSVADLSFILTVGTGPPNYQYPGETPDRAMKTNGNGEAVYRWFPDWEKHESYVDISDPRWVKAATERMVDDTIVVRVRKSQFNKRKRVAGTVTSTDGSVAGFSVSIHSFQGEQKNRSDVLHAITDEHGKFEADYLPGATYCIGINDARFASAIVDVIPFEPTTGKTTVPSLDVSIGQPVEIVVTAGPERRPLAYQWIELTTRHDYSWSENGRIRNGRGGPRRWVTTDDQGKAIVYALPGSAIEGYLSSPGWRSTESTTVKGVGVTRLEFHRTIAAKRKIVGRLVLPDNLETSVNEAVVEIGSVDGETSERLTLKTNTDGKFSFESQASRIGFYARTKDSKASAVSIIDRLDEPIALQLKPTGEYHGQLLGKEDFPLPGHAVRALLAVSGGDYSKARPTSFLATIFESKTDNEGKYSFAGIPCDVTLSLVADSIDKPDPDPDGLFRRDPGNYLGRFHLSPNETRPMAISRLWKAPTHVSFLERYEKTLRDCRLSNFNAMVILFRASDDAKRFVDVNLMDYRKTKEVRGFMQLQGRIGDDNSASAEIAAIARSKNWPIPETGRVFACAIDATGEEIGRIEFNCKDSNDPKLATQFIREHAPEQVDASKKWDEAFAVAKQTNRKVWVRISQRYCNPCFMMARWLDDHKAVLEKEYVLLKIDDVGDLHGDEVAKRITGGKHFGVPFHAIFDADARMLINSESPGGNIGYPNGFEGKKHLKRMLTETRGRLTVQQIEALVASLND